MPATDERYVLDLIEEEAQATKTLQYRIKTVDGIKHLGSTEEVPIDFDTNEAMDSLSTKMNNVATIVSDDQSGNKVIFVVANIVSVELIQV